MNKFTFFLDIDGVLATVKQYNLTQQSKSWIHGSYENGDGVYPFDNKCVEVLNEICWLFDVDIVISSDWRVNNTLEQLQELFKINGVVCSPIDITPVWPTSMSWLEKNRAGEILRYVKEYNVEQWLAIDDLDLFYFLPEDNFVLCKSEWEGIKQSGLKDKIYKKLNNQIK